MRSERYSGASLCWFLYRIGTSSISNEWHENELWREKRGTDRNREIGLERNESRRRETAFEERAAVQWNSRRVNFWMHDKGNLQGLGTYTNTPTSKMKYDLYHDVYTCMSPVSTQTCTGVYCSVAHTYKWSHRCPSVSAGKGLLQLSNRTRWSQLSWVCPDY